MLAPEREPILAPAEELERIERVERVLALEGPGQGARLIGPRGEETELPAALYTVLFRAAHALVAGHGIAIVPVGALLTTQEAANLLNISRPSLIKLLDAGELPYHRVRSHRRIRLSDLLDYRRRRDAAAEAAMRRIVERAQASGTYDDYSPARTR